jgi:tetratricopeptide (TPR) repeat protein
VDAEEFTLKLVSTLKEGGANIWMDQLDILPSQRWDREVHKALVACDCFLFIASERSVDSDNVLDELNYALDNKKMVLPIIINKCELPYRTSRLQHINFTLDYDKGLKALHKTLSFTSNAYGKKEGKENSLKVAGKNSSQISITAYEYFNRGLIKHNQNDYRSAIKDYTEAIELDPTYALSYYNRGLVKHLLNEYQAAIDDYNRAIELDPNYADSYYGRGLSKHMMNEYHTALDDYTRAIALNPKYVTAYYNRGIVRDRLGDITGAIENYTEAIELDPKYVAAYYNRGILKNSVGDKMGAIEDYKISCDLGYENGCKQLNYLSKQQ